MPPNAADQNYTLAQGEIPLKGKVVAVDWGKKRIGLAISDPDQIVCHPLDTLTRRSGRRFPIAALRRHLDAHHIVGVLVGLPLNEDGKDTDSTRAAREIAELIASRTGLPTTLYDERFTSARVLAAVREMDGKTRGREEEIDRLAATVLLQGFLERRRP